MTPSFDEIAEGVGAEERERLLRAHEALLAAGPPPELSPRLQQAPQLEAQVIPFLGKRRRAASFFLAAAVAAAAFAVGFFLGDRGHEFPDSRTVAMHGIGEAANAHASILLGNRDEVGNWPMLVRVRGLEPLERGWYELFLTKDGKKIASCGTFAVREQGVTEVRLNVPYELKRYSGWVIVAYDLETHKTGPPLLRTEDV